MGDEELEVEGRSEAGKERLRNEDHLVIRPADGVVVVADGLGGRGDGEAAARLVAEIIAGAAVDRRAQLGAAFERARAELDAAAIEGKATAAAIRFDRDSVEIAHAGDVRVYLLRAGAPRIESAAPVYCPAVTVAAGASFVCLTRDHSSIADLVERGHVDRRDAQSHPLRSRVNRVVDRRAAGPVERSIALVPGDRLLVCSDGLWNMVDDQRLGALLASSESAGAAVSGLVAAALEAGGRDNVTAAVIYRKEAQ